MRVGGLSCIYTRPTEMRALAKYDSLMLEIFCGIKAMAGPQRYRTTKHVTIVNASSNTLLAFIKIIVGYFARSHALMADGIHSLSDLISDALVLFAAKAGGKVPDANHPYGHQRIETLAAIIIAVLLLLVGASIVYETYRHIYTGKISAIYSLPVIVTALVSIGIKEWLYRFTLSAGKKINSNLLITNAYHNRSDVWVSALVVVSALFSILKIPYADNISASIIALVIMKSGLQLLASGISELIDTGVEPITLNKIRECIQTSPGVVSIHQLRTRSHGGNIFVDAHIIVNTFISVSEGHHIGEKVHEKLIHSFPEIADVTVHIDPENDETSRPSLNLPTRTEIIALLKEHWQNLPGFHQIEKIDIHYFDGQIYVEVSWPANAFSAEQLMEINSAYHQAAQLIPHLVSLKLLVRF
jgi:cation diffusion facilitator family transporter